MRFAIALVLAMAAVPADAKDVDIHDAIDIAANACPMNLGETNSPLRWHAELRDGVWHTWYGTEDNKVVFVNVDAHTGATSDCATVLDYSRLSH